MIQRSHGRVRRRMGKMGLAVLLLAGCQVGAPLKPTVVAEEYAGQSNAKPLTMAGAPLSMQQALGFKDKSDEELAKLGFTRGEVDALRAAVAANAIATAAGKIPGNGAAARPLTMGGAPLTMQQALGFQAKTDDELAKLGFTRIEIDTLRAAIAANAAGSLTGGVNGPGGAAGAAGATGGAAGLVGNGGANLVGNGGAGLVGNGGAGLVGNGGAGLVSNGGAGLVGNGGASLHGAVAIDAGGQPSLSAAQQAAAKQVQAWLSGAPSLTVKAKLGGSYTSPDGSLIVTIPPNALTQDTDVRFTRLDTSGFPVPSMVMPGIRFVADLNGAMVAPDQMIVAKVKADDRTVAHWQASDKDFTPEKYSLSKGADGSWYMQMPVNGPSTTSQPVDPGAASIAQVDGQSALFEFGNLPLPGTPSYKVQTWAQDQFAAHFGRPAPNNMTEWFAYEGQGLFNCGGIESHCWGMQLLHDLGWGVPEMNCAGSQPTPVPIVVANLPAHVTFTSDDPALNGQPAAGCTVRFGLTPAPQNGASEIIADASGNAITHGVAGTSASVQAYLQLGPRTGPAAGTTIQVGMGAVNVTVEKNSPHVNLNFKSDAPLASSLTVAYTLDGAARSTVVLIPNAGDAEATQQIRVDVPDDGTHAFAVTSVTGTNLMLKATSPVGLNVQRNGTYAMTVEMLGNSAK